MHTDETQARTMLAKEKTQNSNGAGNNRTQRETSSFSGRYVGYARVSSTDQNLERQLKALAEWDIDQRNIFTDKASGKNFDRPAYKRMLKRLRKGDTLVIKSLDRLGRNYDEMIQEWRYLVKDKGCNIVVLDMPILDTRFSVDGITGTLIADIVLELFSYVAHIERENIRSRQAEGIQAAKERGVRFGRPNKKPDNWPLLIEQEALGLIKRGEIAVNSGVDISTVHRWFREEKRKENLVSCEN
ncbi:MAG: recombinase family protein [Anaerotardibacter sp.]